QAVGAGLVAGLAAALLLARVAARREEHADPLAFLPLVDGVPRDVREQQVTALLDPDRPLGPDEVLGQLLQLGPLGDQFVEARVVALDLPDRRVRLALLPRHGERG